MNANRCKQHFVKIPILLTQQDVDVCKYECKAIKNWVKTIQNETLIYNYMLKSLNRHR